MTKAKDIISNVTRQLQDIIGTKLPLVMLPYFNLGILEIINLKPDAYPTTENLSLVEGTIQDLPTSVITLIDINCNMGVDGETPGRAIIKIEREILDKLLPFWNMELGTSEVLHVIMDAGTPNIFYVFPPQSEGTNQEIEVIWQSFPLSQIIDLTEGTGQEIEDTSGIRIILDVVRNVDLNGIPGKAIRKITRANLELLLPDWHNYTATTEVLFAMLDPLTPQRFYIFPPQPIDTQQSAEVIADPYPIKGNVELVQGPKQSLPQTAKSLIDVVRNMGTHGETPGRYITKIDKKILDAAIPGWLDYAASGEVQFYVLDKYNPKAFYVFPPQTVSPVKVRAILVIPPDEITDIEAESPLDESFDPALTDYMIFRVLVEEKDNPNTIQRSGTFFNKFLQDLGLKTNVEAQVEQAQDGLKIPRGVPQAQTGKTEGGQ